jgi:hypothetical protein
MVPLRTLALVVLSLCSGCFLFGRPEPDDVDDGPDPLPCEGELEVVEDCPLMDDLKVAIGKGLTTYTPLEPGQQPPISFTGGGQGGGEGQHLDLGFAVDNWSPDYPSVQVQYEILGCDGGPGCEPTQSYGATSCVVSPEDLVETGDGVEASGVRLRFTDWPGAEEGARAVSMTVVDACGRVGALTHLIY